MQSISIIFLLFTYQNDNPLDILSCINYTIKVNFNYLYFLKCDLYKIENYTCDWRYIFIAPYYSKSFIASFFLLAFHISVDYEMGQIHIRKIGGRLALISEKSHTGNEISVLEVNEWFPSLAFTVKITAVALHMQIVRFLSLRVLFQIKGKFQGLYF